MFVELINILIQLGKYDAIAHTWEGKKTFLVIVSTYQKL